MNATCAPATTFAAYLDGILAARLDERGTTFLRDAAKEVEGLTGDALSARFGELLALASRHAKRRPLDLDDDELSRGRSIVDGASPEAWTVLDAARVRLVLALPDLAGDDAAAAIETAFKFGDEGETCALLRSFAFLPGPERFRWRAAEGCRSNMRTVFEAAATDTPFPRAHFDAVAWHQALLKCLFVGAPLCRVFGVDERLDADLARMALDYADERRSADRAVPPELWMLLAGDALGERALHSVEAEIAAGPPAARAGAYLALVRGDRVDLVRAHLENETDALARGVGEAALAGQASSAAFEALRDLEEIELLGPNAARRWRAGS